MRCLPTAPPLGDVWVVLPHRLGSQHLQLSIDALQLRLQEERRDGGREGGSVRQDGNGGRNRAAEMKGRTERGRKGGREGGREEMTALQ